MVEWGCNLALKKPRKSFNERIIVHWWYDLLLGLLFWQLADQVCILWLKDAFFLRKLQQIVQVPDFQEDCNSHREVSITANSHDVPLYGAGPSLKQAILDHHHIPLGLTIDVKSQIKLFGGIIREYFLTTIACDVLLNPDTGSVAATYCEPPKLQDGSTISHLLRGKTTLKGQWKKNQWRPNYLITPQTNCWCVIICHKIQVRAILTVHVPIFLSHASFESNVLYHHRGTNVIQIRSPHIKQQDYT